MTGPQTTKFEAYREYLHLLARLQIAPPLAGKVDLSGVVQQTLWEAAQDGRQGEERADPVPWLRRLLANNLRDEVRKAHAARRDVRREKSLEAALDASSARLENWLAEGQSSPSSRAIRNERLRDLSAALAELPPEQRTAIELHHLQGQPLSVVAVRLERSKEAVASLLYRGLKRLRNRLNPDEKG